MIKSAAPAPAMYTPEPILELQKMLQVTIVAFSTITQLNNINMLP